MARATNCDCNNSTSTNSDDQIEKIHPFHKPGTANILYLVCATINVRFALPKSSDSSRKASCIYLRRSFLQRGDAREQCKQERRLSIQLIFMGFHLLISLEECCLSRQKSKQDEGMPVLPICFTSNLPRHWVFSRRNSAPYHSVCWSSFPEDSRAHVTSKKANVYQQMSVLALSAVARHKARYAPEPVKHNSVRKGRKGTIGK